MNSDGTVLFGRQLLRRKLSQPANPDAFVAAICAHEFGHIVQYKHGLMTRIRADQETVKRAERHADFLAGFFAGKTKLQKPDYPSEVFLTNAYQSGDDHVSSRNH